MSARSRSECVAGRASGRRHRPRRWLSRLLSGVAGRPATGRFGSWLSAGPTSRVGLFAWSADSRWLIHQQYERLVAIRPAIVDPAAGPGRVEVTESSEIVQLVISK